jgi:hypothetical protein
VGADPVVDSPGFPVKLGMTKGGVVGMNFSCHSRFFFLVIPAEARIQKPIGTTTSDMAGMGVRASHVLAVLRKAEIAFQNQIRTLCIN